MSECVIVGYERAHLEGCVGLFEGEGWRTYADQPERTHRAFTAPGSTALVGLVDGRVVAICQLQSDGHVQAHLSTLVVASTSVVGASRAGFCAKCFSVVVA